jgi:hypothetical protein
MVGRGGVPDPISPEARDLILALWAQGHTVKTIVRELCRQNIQRSPAKWFTAPMVYNAISKSRLHGDLRAVRRGKHSAIVRNISQR